MLEIVLLLALGFVLLDVNVCSCDIAEGTPK